MKLRLMGNGQPQSQLESNLRDRIEATALRIVDDVNSEAHPLKIKEEIQNLIDLANLILDEYNDRPQ